MTEKCSCWRPWDHDVTCPIRRDYERYLAAQQKMDPVPCGEGDYFGSVCPLDWLHTEPHQWLVPTQNP